MAWIWALLTLAGSYVVGSIPFAYIIVKAVTGEDITAHGTGNVGAMNVRRTTGSWAWFVAAMVADALKGIVPSYVAKWLVTGDPVGAFLTPWGQTLARADVAWYLSPTFWIPMLAVAGAVAGHNYSLFLAIKNRKFARTGKGLSTGGGSLLAYDWRYFLVVVIVGVGVIALTRYMMAGQVAAAASLPVASFVLRSPDWPFALAMGLLVYAAHHKRFMGLLQGKEPRLYINDRMGPRG